MSAQYAPWQSAAGPASEHEQLVAWRRRALDQQLPAAAFPAGTSAPSLVYLWTTMFVVAMAILGFAVSAHRGYSRLSSTLSATSCPSWRRACRSRPAAGRPTWSGRCRAAAARPTPTC
ncbi:hypothetical protein NKG94_31290 [Micromonospora sp. M12]